MAEVYTPEDFAPAQQVVKILVNGEYYDDGDASLTAGEHINATALDAGFKRFTVLLDGAPFDASRKGEVLAGGSVLEIVAKDDRAAL